jgi:ATP phosphoribosyltransferase
MLTVGLPLGRVAGRSRALAALLVDGDQDPELLYTSSGDRSVRVVFLKHRDIPGLVADGVLDIGVTSFEWVRESEQPVRVLHELDWCDTRVSLLVPDAVEFVPPPSRHLRCVTEFPTLAAGHFARVGLLDVEMRVVSGSTEGMVPGLFDCAIDCVETGKTAARHGLREEAMILASTTVVIVATEHAAAEINKLGSRIR